MNLTSYADLIQAALAQAEPQRLLFVFAQAELPGDATADQERRFRSGEGGALAPVMCVDRSPHDVASFVSLVEESRGMGTSWDIVFVSTMRAKADPASTAAVAGQRLELMVEAIKHGAVGKFLAFTRDGSLVQLVPGNAA